MTLVGRPQREVAGAEIAIDVLFDRIRTFRRTHASFDIYAFADYRGDKADTSRGVVVAVALGGTAIRIVRGVTSRRALGDFFPQLLRAASARNLRVLFGQDHQYGIPLALARELALSTTDWRAAMDALFVSGPFAEHAIRGDAGAFAAAVNAHLEARGFAPYFWTATKRYGIPAKNPRETDHPSARRLGEVGVGFPFCRVGDNGTVGGQSIVGVPHLLRLLRGCEAEGIGVAVWPFDGLHLDILPNKHLSFELYPSAARGNGMVKSDTNDAMASTAWAQAQDRAGTLGRALDLRIRNFDRETEARVRFEGWIVP